MGSLVKLQEKKSPNQSHNRIALLDVCPSTGVSGSELWVSTVRPFSLVALTHTAFPRAVPCGRPMESPSPHRSGSLVSLTGPECRRVLTMSQELLRSTQFTFELLAPGFPGAQAALGRPTEVTGTPPSHPHPAVTSEVPKAETTWRRITR